MTKCLAAFTPPDVAEPPYINASELEDGTVRVIVRSALELKTADGHASIDMTKEQWLQFVIEAVTSAAREQREPPSTQVA